MKKVLAIVLAIMMVFACLPFAASAKVAKDDSAVNYLLTDDNFYHLSYVKAKNNFKSEIITYSALNAYDDAWKNLVTGSKNISAAEAILLALIEKVEAEYNNETFEKIIKVLEGAKTVADVVKKVDDVTGILDLAENAEWAEAISGLGTIIKAANYANSMYEYAVEAYATILSAQAASEYFGDLLDYIAGHATNKDVVTAAKNVKANISKTYEEAIEELLEQIAAKIAGDGVGMGIEVAMDAWSVTAVIKTVYNTVSGLTTKVFNTKDKASFMISLAMLTNIEACFPEYVAGVFTNGTDDAAEFALSSLLTIRETGENMVMGLSKVYEDTIADKLIANINYNELKRESSKGVATIAVLRDLISAETAYTTYAPQAIITTAKDVVVKNAQGEVIASVLANTINSAIDENGAFVTTYSDTIAGTVTVIVPFIDGVVVEVTDAAGAAEDSTSKPSGYQGNFFERLIQAIKDIFAKLFSFGKK